MKKYVYLIFIILNIFITIFGCSIKSEPAISNEPNLNDEIYFNIESDSDILQIYTFNVGKADAFLIKTKNFTVMIDTGENKHGAEIAAFLSEKNITVIDYLIITHFHKDHIGGAHIIIDNITVNEIIVPNYGKESKHYERFVSAAEKTGTEINVIKETTEFMTDGAKFIVYPPQSEYYYFKDVDSDDDEDDDNAEELNGNNVGENDYSLVITINHGNNNFLFTGDAKSKRLEEILSIEDIINTEYDFLKVPHHGRYNKKSIDFIKMVKPQYAVITCSEKDPPNKKIISALAEMGAEIYYTVNGDIYCVSNGESLLIKYYQN